MYSEVVFIYFYMYPPPGGYMRCVCMYYIVRYVLDVRILNFTAITQLANKRAGRRWRRPRCLSGSPDEAGPSLSRVARSAGRSTASPCLAKLNIDLTWLTSALRTWTISRRTRTNKETHSGCLRQSSGSSARSDVGKPLGYDI